jgi:hypothetical protein
MLDGAPSPDEPVLSHFEQIGEIGAERDLEVESGRCKIVVDEIEIFVHAVAHGSPEHELETPFGDLAVFGRNGRVDEEHARGEVRRHARGEPVPAQTVGVDGVVAHVPGVVGEEAGFARRRDLAR